MECFLDQRNSTAAATMNPAAFATHQGRGTDSLNPDGNRADSISPGDAVHGEIDDWLTFANHYTGWGSAGCHAQPDCSGMGPCISGDVCTGNTPRRCQVYDFRVIQAHADAWLQTAALPTGNDAIVHAWDPTLSQQQCETLFPGAEYDLADNRCKSTFANHAIELVGDWIGNENYLCESGEVCIHTPFATAYQGHGKLVPTEISPGVVYTWVDGAITGVSLLRYEERSVPGPHRP